MRHRGWSNWCSSVCSDKDSVRPHCEDASRRSKHAPFLDGCPGTVCGVSRKPLWMPRSTAPMGSRSTAAYRGSVHHRGGQGGVCGLRIIVLFIGEGGGGLLGKTLRGGEIPLLVLGLKRGERWVTRHLGPYAVVWARWLRRLRQGSGLLLGSATFLEEGMRDCSRVSTGKKHAGTLGDVQGPATYRPNFKKAKHN